MLFRGCTSEPSRTWLTASWMWCSQWNGLWSLVPSRSLRLQFRNDKLARHALLVSALRLVLLSDLVKPDVDALFPMADPVSPHLVPTSLRFSRVTP
jgi:hypothetical protein